MVQVDIIYIMKNKIFEILKKSIQTFAKLDKIEIISTFGSILKNKTFNDLDLIIISNKKTHDKFVEHLKSEFVKEGYEPIFFETILKKPNRKKETEVFIHDLNYRDLSDLLNKEWKSVINTMKLEMTILNGDKNFPDKLPFYKLSKTELLNPIIKWSKRISSEEEFKVFKQYLLKIIPRLLEDYNYLNLNNLKIIQEFLIQKISWNKKLKETKKFLT